jgi:hypothetical protein
MGLEDQFQEYFSALDKTRGQDRCYLCCRTPAEVKFFFGFDEDGTPLAAEEFGIEDVVLEQLDVMSYRGVRPICAVCQLNLDAIFLLDEKPVLRELIDQAESQRDDLWPEADANG